MWFLIAFIDRALLLGLFLSDYLFLEFILKNCMDLTPKLGMFNLNTNSKIII